MASYEEAQFIFHHVFLPPKLPGESDEDSLANTLLEQVRHVSFRFLQNLNTHQQEKWSTVSSSIGRWINVYHEEGFSLGSVMGNILPLKLGETLLLHIKSQNAAVLIHRERSGATFEAFEVLPTTEAVLASQGALLRTFPARSVFLDTETLKDKIFMENLITHLHKLAEEQTSMSLETVVKAKNTMKEVRQTEHPRLVTEWFFAILACRGKKTATYVTANKRIRDEVSWNDSLKPWRRSPLWLCIRVGLRLMLGRVFREEASYVYKMFMMTLMCHFSRYVLPSIDSIADLHVIRTKLARRNGKLDSRISPRLRKHFLSTIESIRDAMEMKWNAVTLESKEIPRLTTDLLEKETSLQNSSQAINEIMIECQKRREMSSADPFVKPAFIFSFDPNDLPEASAFTKTSNIQVLHALNSWVRVNLHRWVDGADVNGRTCAAIEKLICCYFQVARLNFGPDPDLMSESILVVLELWVVLDMMTVRQHPLLKDFSPEIPHDLFSPLRLAKKGQMHRLALVIRYLIERHNGCRVRTPTTRYLVDTNSDSPQQSLPKTLSVFDEVNLHAFGVQYFEADSRLQELDQEIEAHSKLAKKRVLKDYETKMAEYRAKKNAAASLPHDKFWAGDRFKHDRDCQRCRLEFEARRLSVRKYEEPLPQNLMKRAFVVFELQPPEAFVAWRDATHMLLMDVFNAAYKSGAVVKQTLAAYWPLQRYLQLPNRRVGLGSQYKAFSQSHYIYAELNTTVEDELIITHGLDHKLHDSQKTNVWVSGQRSHLSITKYCRPRLPANSPFASLSETIQHCGHSQNGVMARQSKCPMSLSTHEFVAFGSMRTGEYLQSLNILRNLLCSDIDLNSPSVVVVFEQILHEVGTACPDAGNTFYGSHQHFGERKFAESLLVAIEKHLPRIETNWKETSSMRCLLLVAQRVVTFCYGVDEQIVHRGLDLIRRIRKFTLKWTIELANKCSQARHETFLSPTSTELQKRVLDGALLTRASWNVDIYLRPELLASQDDLKDYVVTSIFVSDYQKLCHEPKNDTLSKFLLRDQMIALDYVEIVTLPVFLASGISSGIQARWQGLKTDSRWVEAHGRESQWMLSSTILKGNPIHWNVLTGELLVNSRPVSVLPDEYSQSLIYQQVFGDQVIDVMPSDLPWMQFMTTTLVCGNRIHFGKSNGHIIMEAFHDSSQYGFRAMPRDLLNDDLPTSIINQTQPWVCLNDWHVELRDQDHQWDQEKQHWIMKAAPSGNGMYSVTRGDVTLIGHKTQLGHTIGNIFQGFENSKHLEIMYDGRQGLKVELPRYRLTFTLHQETSRLRCLQLDAEIDGDQSVSTFYGLQSRLVLSMVNSSNYDKKRLVLIPYGPLDISPTDNHVRVLVEGQDTSTAFFFKYKIDQNLCQIDAEGHIEAHLFKAYLHAVTGSALPDILTDRTGIEEALCTLHDTVSRTSIPLSKTANDILRSISLLTPIRKFYPDPQSQTLQTVQWHRCLPFLSQYDGFVTIATDLSTNSILTHFLYDGSKQEVPEYLGEQHLRERALRHNAMYYMAMSSQLEELPKPEDTTYSGRVSDGGHNQVAAYTIAMSFYSKSAARGVQTPLYAIMEEFESLSGFVTGFEPANISELLSLEMKIAWPCLLTTCVTVSADVSNALALQLSLVAFGNPELMPLLVILITLVTSKSAKALQPFTNLSYDLTVGRHIDGHQVMEILRDCLKKQFTNFSHLQNQDEVLDSETELITALHDHLSLVLNSLRESWPHDHLLLPHGDDLPYIDLAMFQSRISEQYKMWRDNHSLYKSCLNYDKVLKQLDETLDKLSTPYSEVALVSTKISHVPISLSATPAPSCLMLLDAFKGLNIPRLLECCPPLSECDRSLQHSFGVDCLNSTESPHNYKAEESFNALLNHLQQSSEPGLREISDSLKSSLYALKQTDARQKNSSSLPNRRMLELEYSNTHIIARGYLDAFKAALVTSNEAERGFRAAGLCASIDPRSILQLLSTSRYKTLPRVVSETLFSFARAIAAKQRLARMIHFKFTGDNFSLKREIDNDAHAAWDIRQHPEWLLLEIQNDFLIRPVQIQVANNIVTPQNGIVQLGMGEGKTSVILPMAVLALSEGAKLVRVVVLKSLANEMLRSLSQTLSGLVARPVYHLPFSRSTQLTTQDLKNLSVARDSCKTMRGVLLALPEHLNSFRLMGNDQVVADQSDLFPSFLGTQKCFDHNAIDILDECDEILHPRVELVYTSGTPKPLSGAPDRWCILLDLLGLVDYYAGTIAAISPTSIDYIPTSLGAFPHVRLLQAHGYANLEKLLLRDIKLGALPQLPLTRHSEESVDCALDFIQNPHVDSGVCAEIRNLFRKESEINCLYLLRGIFAGGHLRAVFESRWFVNYGLDRSRSLAAVPYRAKSTPAAAAEFAQPDIMIMFTALSYYYTGIQLDDLRYCLALLLKSPDPADEYSKWTSISPVDQAYRHISAINIESDMCVEKLYEWFKMNKLVIGFFLRRVVFPREAKEYPQKLCSSAWDLCHATSPQRFVSGFSGTCDVLLPLTMPKQDIPELRHYDAAVIMDLLKVRNSRYVYAGDDSQRPLETHKLLELISNDKSKPSVIIDVGAQILDVNHYVAREWLMLRRDKLACVFFNDENEKTVMTQSGSIESWKSSPFKEQVDKCLIFLDEFHTRGTDFQLPDDFTAAVLLGPRLRKDALVQACMRMRKLAFSQSLVFVGPPEVDGSIRTLLNYDLNRSITSVDIVEWTINQSSQAREKQLPLWVDRGLAFSQRRYAFDKLVRAGGSVPNRQAYLRAILQTESHEVNVLYGPALVKSLPSQIDFADPMVKELVKHRDACETFNNMPSFQEQEQEREVLHEVEQEREVERPDSMNPQVVKVNEELWDIIRVNQRVQALPKSLTSAFDVLDKTSLRNQYSRNQWPPYLLATEDFLNPVKVADGSDIDDFLRPVHWLLVLRDFPHIILISCHEANAYMNDLKRSTVATMTLYHPLVRRDSESFDGLDVFQVSAMPNIAGVNPRARTALRLFAGQLYFNDFKEYTEFCYLLGLWDGKMDLKGQTEAVERHTNHVPKRIRDITNGWTGKWRSNPVEIVKRFIAMRRQNEEWLHTHVGRVLSGLRLTDKDFL